MSCRYQQVQEQLGRIIEGNEGSIRETTMMNELAKSRPDEAVVQANSVDITSTQKEIARLQVVLLKYLDDLMPPALSFLPSMKADHMKGWEFAYSGD